MESGIQADFCAEQSIKLPKKLKLNWHNSVTFLQKNVIESIDVETIYQVPLELQKQNLMKWFLRELALPVNQESDLKDWKNFLKKYKKS